MEGGGGGWVRLKEDVWSEFEKKKRGKTAPGADRRK